MQFRSCIAIALAAAIVSPAPALAQPSDLESMALSASFVVAIPFAVFAPSGEAISGALGDSIADRTRWTVEAVHPQGEKTVIALRSEDRQRRLDIRVDPKVVQALRLRVGDGIGTERVGNTGYVVKKGSNTIGMLVEPGSGMVHSKPRN